MIAVGVTAAVVLVTLVLAIALLRSVTRGVARLTERSQRIQQGELAIEPIPPGGPRDIALLTGTFNDMAETLRGVDERASALAGGGDLASSTRALPGRIGEAMDRSVARLSQATRTLRAREALSRSIVASAADAVWTVDPDGVIRSANGAASRTFGLAEDEMTGRLYGDVAPVALVCARAGGEGRPRPLDGEEMELPHRDGHMVTVLVSTTEVLDEDGRPLRTIFANDISERRAQEQRLEHQATHDDLTGLANRTRALFELDEALTAAGTHPGGVGLLFIDLDDFKNVNDALGHRVGDELLVATAGRLQALVRPDDLVARIGGDEFVVLVRRAEGSGDLIDLAERVIDGLRGPIQLSGERAWVGASIGVTWSPAGHESAEDMLRDADIALYAAKRAGRGKAALFDARMQAETAEQSAIERALREALSGPGLSDHYQPIIDLVSGEAVGAELLARLEGPDGALISPGRFIPIAEDSGLIVEVGRWALATACARIAQWEADGRDTIRISVNISGLHLASGELVDDVAAAASVLDGGLHRLGIEITESSLVRDEPAARRTLAELREMGVAISLDDFGTGYSSLSYLRELPIDVLKIDRSFIAQMHESEMDDAIVASVVDLARACGLRVVAEGIETDAQAARVGVIGCHLAQGFLYSRPVPFDQLAAHIITLAHGAQEVSRG